MHSFEGLADEISTLLKNRGDTGDRGDKLENTSRNNILAVTPCCASLSPLEIEGCQVQSRVTARMSQINHLPVVSPVSPLSPVFLRKVERRLRAINFLPNGMQFSQS